MDYPKASQYLKPIHALVKVFGMFPDFAPSESTKRTLYLVYSLCLLALTTNSIVVDFAKHYSSHRDIVCFTVLLGDVLGLVSPASTVLLPILFSKIYVKISNRLLNVEKLVHSLNIRQKESPTKHCQCFWIFASFLIVGYTFYVYLTSFRDATPIVAIGYMLAYSLHATAVIHLLSLLSVIKSKVVSINWHLDYLNNRFPVYLQPSDGEKFLENKIHGKHVEGMFVNYCADVRCVTAHKIRTFNQIHFLLYSTCNLISKYFAFRMFTYVLRTALSAIVISMIIFGQQEFVAFHKLSFVLTIGYNYSLIFLVANSFYEIQYESQKTALSICNLLDEEHPADVESELQTFAKQMRSRAIRFSACGFFDVDLKMITSMVGLGLPVTLFLVQYYAKQRTKNI